MGQIVDMTGRRFGRLRVVAMSGRNKWRYVMWRCACDCGGEIVSSSNNLRFGKVSSCGCLGRHGHTAGSVMSPTYLSWRSMRARCLNPNATDYRLYGGRGITVCARWDSFANFLADMGERPEGRTLDRVDPNGNYEPTNCRWATSHEQALNKRKRRAA